jgi:hypothetical protein
MSKLAIVPVVVDVPLTRSVFEDPRYSNVLVEQVQDQTCNVDHHSKTHQTYWYREQMGTHPVEEDLDVE